MRMPPLLADFIHARACIPKCEKFLTLPYKMLQDESIAQSFSRPGNPLDNAVSESFFVTYKKEELYCKEFLSYEELAKGIADYIHYYNTERPHKKVRVYCTGRI